MEHTKLPWVLDEVNDMIASTECPPECGCGENCYHYIAECFDSYGEYYYRSQEEVTANAAFIVKACNNHDALAAMVQRLLERYRCDDSMGDAALADAAGALLARIGDKQ